MSARAFREARDILLKHRADHATASAEFRWPELERFDRPRDYFDHYAQQNPGPHIRPDRVP